MHARMYTRRYIHVYTPTDGRPVERSPWSQLGSNIRRHRPVRGVSIRQTHTRGFHPCYHLAARPHLVNSAHLYEHTHTYTPYMLAYESWFLQTVLLWHSSRTSLIICLTSRARFRSSNCQAHWQRTRVAMARKRWVRLYIFMSACVTS